MQPAAVVMISSTAEEHRRSLYLCPFDINIQQFVVRSTVVMVADLLVHHSQATQQHPVQLALHE